MSEKIPGADQMPDFHPEARNQTNESEVANEQEKTLSRLIERHASNAALLQSMAMKPEIEEKMRENFKSGEVTPQKIDEAVDQAYFVLKDMYASLLRSGRNEPEAAWSQAGNKPLLLLLGLTVTPDPEKVAEIRSKIIEAEN